MKMVSFRQRDFGKDGVFLTFDIDNDADLDDDVLDFIEDEEPIGIVPVIFEDEEDQEYDQFSYDITDKIKLSEMGNQENSSEIVLKVLRGLAISLTNMGEYRIPLSYLVLNRNYIYINSDYQVEFICIPVEGMQEEVDINSFLRNYISTLRFDPTEDNNYVAELFNYINDNTSFNLRNLATFVEEIMEERGIEVPEDNENDIVVEYTEVEEESEPEVTEPKTEPEAEVKEAAEPEAEVEETAEPAKDEEKKEQSDTKKDAPNQEKKIKFGLKTPVEEEPVEEEDDNLYRISDHVSEEAPEEEAENDESADEKADVADDVEEAKEEDSKEETIEESVETTSEENIIPETEEDSAKDDGENTETDNVESAKAENDKKGKKPSFKTKEEPSVTGVVIEDELDDILSNKKEPAPHKDEIGLKVKKNIKVSRASIVMNSVGEQTEEEPAAEETAPEETMTQEEIANAVMSKANPYLIRVNTDERIMIRKQNFKLGKASMGVDYSVRGNGAVSRVHAIITNKDGIYYIKDNKSTNHTFVDGKEVPEGENLELKDGCRITLGDEEFDFKF